MLEKCDDVVFSNYEIDLDDIDSDIITCLSNDTGFVTIGLKNISLMMIILMTMILNMLDLCLGVIDISIEKHLKKNRQRINAYSMISNKSVGLVYNKR